MPDHESSINQLVNQLVQLQQKTQPREVSGIRKSAYFIDTLASTFCKRKRKRLEPNPKYEGYCGEFHIPLTVYVKTKI